MLGRLLLTEMRAATLHDFEGDESLGSNHTSFLNSCLADLHTLLKLRQLFQQASLTCAGLSCHLQATFYAATFKEGISCSINAQQSALAFSMFLKCELMPSTTLEGSDSAMRVQAVSTAR